MWDLGHWLGGCGPKQATGQLPDERASYLHKQPVLCCFGMLLGVGKAPPPPAAHSGAKTAAGRQAGGQGGVWR